MTPKDNSVISVQFDADESVNVRIEDAQIQAVLNRAAADNPDLPRKFIQEVLLAEVDVNNGLYRPYMRKSDKL